MSLLLVKAARPTVSLGVRRSLSTNGTPSLPPPARVQVAKPVEPGHYDYNRNWSRDTKYNLDNAPQKGDTPLKFLTRRLGHAYEIYPLFVLTGAWFLLFCYASYKAFNKIEIWLDRSKGVAPWDWSRSKDTYFEKPTVQFGGVYVMKLDTIDTHRRLEIMERLQDEMMEAAKKRGTRN